MDFHCPFLFCAEFTGSDGEVDGRVYKNSLSGIVRAVEVGIKAIIVCSPENPSQTGYPIGEADYRFAYKLFAFGVGAFLLGFFLFAPISARMRR